MCRFNPTDVWFRNLKQTHNLLDKHMGYSKKKVKIAVLDTGVARRKDLLFLGGEAAEHVEIMDGLVKRGYDLKNGLPPNEDVDGHGTDCAFLLWRVCPYAYIYPYRILKEKDDDINHQDVANALKDAYKKKVDIISMSFGWERDEDQLLEDVLYDADKQEVLLFAATGNNGADINYPARSRHVFAIDAADHNGVDLPSNPRDDRTERFTALGQNVLSVTKRNALGPERKTGTSFATPIAAATAGLILEFAMQPPLCFEPKVLKRLKTMAGMHKIFNDLSHTERATFHLLSTSTSLTSSASNESRSKMQEANGMTLILSGTRPLRVYANLLEEMRTLGLEQK